MKPRPGRSQHPPVAGARCCAHCQRPAAEILAAHRLDVIRIAIDGIGYTATGRSGIRPHLRKIAKRLRVPYLALLECVDVDILASDLSGLPTTRCTAATNAECGNEAAGSAAAIESVRAEAGVEALAVFLDEVEDGYEYDGLNLSGHNLTDALHLPALVQEVLCARVVGGYFDLSDIDAFNAWHAAQPAAAQLLEDM